MKLNKSEETNNISPDDFNNYFLNIAQNLLKHIPISHNDPLKYLGNTNTTDANFSFSEVTYNEVRDIVHNFKNKNGRDIYGLNAKIVKSVKNLILIPLTKIINLCIRERIFPACLKDAIVPIFKKGDNSLPENYRPISLLPIISKIFEKCLAKQIVHYFETNELFSKSQFGFREGKTL